MASDFIIRPYKCSDRNAVRDIAFNTALKGESADGFFEDKDLLCDWLMRYYTDFEPGSLFVAEYNDRPVGYIAGCVDTNTYKMIFNKKILPGLAMRTFFSLFFMPKARRFIRNALRSFFRGEFSRPDFNKEYPGHLHLNLEKDFRGKGIGTNLINRFLELLINRNIQGAQAWTFSPTGKALFERSGFTLLYRQRITYFDYLLKEELFLHCYGKEV